MEAVSLDRELVFVEIAGMTLRKQLLIGSVTAAAVVGILGTLAIEGVRARDRRIALERASAAAIVDHMKDACDASPNWFLAGPREGRPTPEELAQPDADVYTKRPDTKPRPFEFFAFDETFRGMTTAAPRFPDNLRVALKSGSEVASESWKGPDGTGVQTARWTAWPKSECAILLFRAAPSPHQRLEQAGIFTGLFVLTLAVASVVGSPTERRATTVAHAMRESARNNYAAVLPAPGNDEITSINALFNDAAAQLRQRFNELREQQEALRRLSAETDTDVIAPLAAVPQRLGDILRSVSLTPAVREQTQAALRDAQTVALRGANLVVAARLRDRDAPAAAESVDLTALVTKVVSEHEMFAHAFGVNLSATVPSAAVMATGDPLLFEAALTNLVDNAIRYNKPGGAVLVDLDGEARGHFRLIVSDDGVGVNDAMLKYVNGVRRFRGDERRRHREDEVGLGLAIVHEVTGRAHIGLSFRRKDNGGLEVTLEFRTAPSAG
jgi:signal transduction histidine kinase